MMQSLLIAKDVGVATNFQPIFDLTDTSWIADADPAMTKELLLVSYRKLSRFSDSGQLNKEFEKFLKITNTFDEAAITQIRKHFAPLIEQYFKRVSRKKIRQKCITDL